jgi:hypothetical protein
MKEGKDGIYLEGTGNTKGAKKPAVLFNMSGIFSTGIGNGKRRRD